jgi:hypothetical protein
MESLIKRNEKLKVYILQEDNGANNLQFKERFDFFKREERGGRKLSFCRRY